MKEILEPLDELKRTLADHKIDIYVELSFISKRSIQAVLSGQRNVKRAGDQVNLSPKWEAYFRKLLDRRKVLLTPTEQAAQAIEKLFLSIFRLLEEDPGYGLKLIHIALERCSEYDLSDYKKELQRFEKIFIEKAGRL